MVRSSTLIPKFIFEILLIYEIQSLAGTTVCKIYFRPSRFLWKGTHLAAEIINAFKNMTGDFSHQIGDKASLVKFLIGHYLLSSIYPLHTWSCIMALGLPYSSPRESPCGSNSKGWCSSDWSVLWFSPQLISRCYLQMLEPECDSGHKFKRCF